MTRILAEDLASRSVDTVVGVARAGLLPATAVACALRCDLFPVRLTRRSQDRVVSALPVWQVDASPLVRGRRVAVIDEIADSGETLRLVAERVHALGASEVSTAVLVAHSWADPLPDVAAIDRRWQLHPELAEALGTGSA